MNPPGRPRAPTETLPIHERFLTFQGEGQHAGRGAFFIRTYGCPVHCPWCDSAGTWHPDWTPAFVNRMTIPDLASEISQNDAAIIVITGGEPAVHDLTPLCEAIHALDREAHIETSGAFPIRGAFDWITVSPKWWRLPLPESIERADELKIIVEDDRSIALWETELGTAMTEHPLVRLHPEWSQRANPAVLRRIAERVARHPNYRAGWQMHKLYMVDALDERTAPTVPLGGTGGPST